MTNREYVMLEDKNGKEVLPVTDGNGVFVEGGTKKLDKKLTEINEQLDNYTIAERERVDNENLRVAAESERVAAEKLRITAEQNREENARTLEARVNEKISEYNTATLITNAEIDTIIANALK